MARRAAERERSIDQSIQVAHLRAVVHYGGTNRDTTTNLRQGRCHDAPFLEVCDYARVELIGIVAPEAEAHDVQLHWREQFELWGRVDQPPELYSCLTLISDTTCRD